VATTNEAHDDFPRRIATTWQQTATAPRSSGVRMAPHEEAANRFGRPTEAELAESWRAWDEYSAAMSRWIDGRGPRPV